MAGEEKWIFTPSQLANTPSRRCGIDSDKELNYRQQLANFIQDMGQKLQVTQLCINTAIVYMHRFYMYHSFTAFNKHSMASACVFLAAKVEEQPRKLEHVIRVVHMCLHRDTTPPDTKSEAYLKEAQELVINENILLQSLGFEITVDHPHTHVVKTCQLVRASKDLAQTSYFLATNSLHLTTMCLQYKPTVVSCVCIHLACKWSSWEIPRSSEDKEWFVYTDRSVTSELLEELTQNFLNILEKCPSKLKKKIMTWKEEAGKKSSAPGAGPVTSAPQEVRQKPSHTESRAPPPPPPPPQAGSAGHTSSSSNRHEKLQTSVAEPGMRRVKTEPNLSSLTPQEYRERKERERAILNAQHAILKPSTMSERERHHLDALAAPAAHPERPRDSHRDHKSAHHHPHRTGDRTQLPRSHADPTQHRHEIHKPGHDPPFKDGRMDVEARSRDAHSNREQNMINRDSLHGHTEGKKSREQLQSQAAPPPPPAPVKAEAPPESERSKVRDMHRTHVNLLPAKDENPLLDLFKENKVSMEPLPAAEMLMAELAKPVVDPVDDPIKVEPRAPPRQTSMVSLAAEAAKTEVAAVKQETTVKQEIKPEVKQETALKESSATSSPALTGSQESPKLPKISFAQLRERKHAEALKLASEHPSPKKSKRDRTDRTDSGEKKDLKLKIVNLGGSPGVASVKRQDESRSSPHGTGDLKLKLDLKAHRRHEHRSERSRSSDPASADAAVHRSSSSSSTSNPPLKLKLKLGPGSSGSPSTSSSHREHRHHHHRHSSHHSNGSHSSRKRGHNSPASNTPASKMPRNDSIPNSATITNGNDSESPAVKIDALTRQLQMLIDAQKSQLQHQGAKQPDGMPPLPPVGLQLPAVPPPPPPPE